MIGHKFLRYSIKTLCTIIHPLFLPGILTSNIRRFRGNSNKILDQIPITAGMGDKIRFLHIKHINQRGKNTIDTIPVHWHKWWYIQVSMLAMLCNIFTVIHTSFWNEWKMKNCKKKYIFYIHSFGMNEKWRIAKKSIYFIYLNTLEYN